MKNRAQSTKYRSWRTGKQPYISQIALDERTHTWYAIVRPRQRWKTLYQTTGHATYAEASQVVRAWFAANRHRLHTLRSIYARQTEASS